MLPERALETADWLAKAMLDLRAAERLLSGDPPLLEPAVFHCQQAAEKALKGYLVWHNCPFSKTHDLVALLGVCLTIDTDFAALQEAGVVLTPYAVAFRYPGTVATLAREQAIDALRLARQVLSFVLERLPSELGLAGSQAF